MTDSLAAAGDGREIARSPGEDPGRDGRRTGDGPGAGRQRRPCDSRTACRHWRRGGSGRNIAHVTPHAWAIDGFRTLIFRHGGVVDVLPQLAVLGGMAASSMALGAWGLRRAVTRG